MAEAAKKSRAHLTIFNTSWMFASTLEAIAKAIGNNVTIDTTK